MVRPRIPTVEFLQRGDFGFSANRTILLPTCAHAREQSEVVDAIALIADLLSHLHEIGEPRRVLVVGHTGASGSTAYDIELAALRAENVYCLLSGDRSSWASLGHVHAQVADERALLRWVARDFGWDCDPGPLDDLVESRTAVARSRFRARALQVFGQQGGDADRLDPADWEVLFDLIEFALAARLAMTHTELAGLRADVVFVDPPILACGERWSKAQDAPDPASTKSIDHRVEVLLFHPDELPDTYSSSERLTTQTDEDAPGGWIYAPGSCHWQAIPPGPEVLADGACFEIGLSPDGHYRLRAGSPDATAGAGQWSFQVRATLDGVCYSLDYEPPALDPLMLFSDDDLDDYLSSIGSEPLWTEQNTYVRLPARESTLGIAPEDEEELFSLDELDIELLDPDDVDLLLNE